MDFDRHCAEIVTQTELLTSGLRTADLRASVPPCPGWSLGNLVRHIGGGHRWAEEIVRTRATEFRPDDQVRKLDGDDSADLPAAWLLDGASRLAATLRAAGPDAALWTPFEYATTAFWARRFAHETLVHRADATLAAGVGFEVSPEMALDAIDEWVELDVNPAHFDLTPDKRDVLGPGRTVALEAPEAAWFIDLTGEVITWRRGPGEAAVTVRGSLTELLLMIYRRRSAAGLDVRGDEGLLRHWLGHVAFG